MRKTKQIYFNFPVQLLSGFLVDSNKCLRDILNYAIVCHSNELQHGSELERIKASLDYFAVSISNIRDIAKNGSELIDSIPHRSPIVGINKDVYFDFLENDKSEYEKICLLGFLGIKSIIGDKAYCKMTNLYLLSRMDGKLKSVNDNMELTAEIRKYSTEYQTKKLTAALLEVYNVSTYKKHTRGFFASTKLDMPELLEAVLESKKSMNYIDAYKKAVQEAEDKLKKKYDK